MEPTSGDGNVSRANTGGLSDLAKPRVTLRRLAEYAGVSPSLVYKVASGERRPNAAIRRAVEEFYGIPARSLFGDQEARAWTSKHGSSEKVIR